MQTQDKPLYCFLYNEDDGSITRTTITKYTYQATGFINVQFAGSGMKLRRDSLDQLHYNKVFTFNPDPEVGKKVVYASLNEKLEKAYRDLKKCQARLMVFKARQEVRLKMTEEQAKFLYSIAYSMGTTGIEDFTCKDGEKMIEIIHALEHQSSEDCVSRADVLKGYIEIERVDGVEVYLDKAIPAEYVEALPPVTPVHKQGEWVKDYNNSALDGLYHCSVCNRKLWIPKEESVLDYPYCHCGADMRGNKNE